MNMPKLNGDEIKKLVLSTMGFVFLLYAYFTFFLGPLNRSRLAAQKSITDIQHKLDSSKTDMQKATNLERQAKDATARFAAFKSFSPEGAPIAWFPPRMKGFFADRQVDKAAARLESNSSFKEAELAEWTKYNWLIEVPKADFNTIGQTLADLENLEPLLSINKLNIHTVVDQPQFQQVAIAVTTVIDKR